MSDLVRAGSLGKGGLGGVGRQTRVERPRPLKMSGGREPELRHEDLLVLLEAVLRALVSRQYDGQMVGQVAGLCANLKRSGASLETSHKELMDKLLSAMVAACRDDGLDLVCRVHMLEIIELRSMGWLTNENVTNYYKQKLAQIDTPPSRPQTAPVQLNPAAPDFNPCGKDGLTPTSNLMRKQPELPTAAPRALNRPRPSAPRPAGTVGGDNNSLLLPTTSHSEVVVVGGEQLQVSGSSAELVRTARVVLHEFFNVCGGPQADPMGRSSESVGSQDAAMASPPRSKNNSGESSDTGPVTGAKELLEEEDDGPELVLTKPELCYEKETLLQLSKSPLCRATPERWSELVADLPGVVRRADRAGPTSKLILREMEEIRRQEAAPKFQ